jgi:hypothetical protein
MFSIAYLLEIFYPFGAADIIYIICLQNWGDYTDMSQGVYIYLIYASDVLLICWFGTQLSQHVRQDDLL